ncbi:MULTISPECIES: fimbrial protein [Pantoea]|uniref:Fimbrial-type adhesion domain-containing protein n=1 Tax=Pantoea stewartii TaxID=66269 RepID=A0AB34VDP0_9GAMM|nr:MULTISPECIES: fimbrial protein [Pantoea]KTS71420.1 hypothetical protein RSA30_18105 [Pantoea stewartii]KTS94523.1 hypothetical protein RSA13_17655 [Pantoea stewartii]KTT08154.1 hypothetical protein RSA36_09645 [Pantoea stewartii]MEB6534946.1 fimbrial protein [Pantoea stewartii]WRH21889.1 fimbrial protein [Pantoea sp. JZ29]
MKNFLNKILFFFCLISSLPASAVSEGDITTVNISGTIVEDVTCTVNHGNAIQVFLGDDIFIDKIDGKTYKKTAVPINLDCTEATKGIVQTLSFKASGVGVGCDKYLCTDYEGLMLKIYHNNDVLNLEDKVSYVTLANGTAMVLDGGSLDFYVVPLKKEGVKIKSGTFSSVATLVVDMQ